MWGVITVLFGIVVICPWHRLPLLVAMGWYHLLGLPNVTGTHDPPYKQRLIGMGWVLVACPLPVLVIIPSLVGGRQLDVAGI
jgi:hypothetical protein